MRFFKAPTVNLRLLTESLFVRLEMKVTTNLMTINTRHAALGRILRSRWAKPELKGPLFTAVVLPVLLYGSESFFIDAAVTARIADFYNGRVRSMR